MTGHNHSDARCRCPSSPRRYRRQASGHRIIKSCQVCKHRYEFKNKGLATCPPEKHKLEDKGRTAATSSTTGTHFIPQ
jgi:hypothetical protein